ncbi:substrate-binding domain-containing protein [Paraburkholderia sp. 2C]|jgi:ABC-type phosphate transport system substrate-binding protein
MKSSKRKISLAVALVISGFGAVAAAQAATPTLVGGGSTLVQPTIGSESAVFPVADGTVTYFGVGSGAGQTAFLNNDSTQFSAGLHVTVDFANSDAPLSSAQVSAYKNALGTTNGPLIQIPYIVTPITIPLVNAPAGTGPVLNGAATVALNDDDLCGIFSGKITSWTGVTNPDTGAAYTSGGPITVIFRSDASGTTDLLTAHLAAVCNTNNTAVGVTFRETQHFAGTPTSAVADAIFPSGAPSNFSSASGSGGVAALLATFKAPNTAAAVAYLSPDWTNTALAPLSAQAQANQLAVASVRNGNADVLPTFTNASTAVGQGTLPTDVTDPTQWVPHAAAPTTGYPISGTSQIIVSQCYQTTGSSPTVAASVVDFLNLHYNSNASILHGNGFDTVPAQFLTAINNDFLAPPRGSTLNLNIGNATACKAFAGR